MTKPPKNVLELPLEQRAEMALKAAVEKVIVERELSAGLCKPGLKPDFGADLNPDLCQHVSKVEQWDDRRQGKHRKGTLWTR
jgi:hypothetical protein